MSLVIRRLKRTHDRKAFDCGKESLTRWFRKSARQNDSKGHTRVWVLADDESPGHVLGYFAVCASSIGFDSVPEELKKNFPKYPIPSILLARLALSKDVQGRGLGAHILIEALRKAVEASDSVGVPIVEVDALDEEAKAFYEHYGFKASMSAAEPMKLFLSMNGAREAVEAADLALKALEAEDEIGESDAQGELEASPVRRA